MKKCKKCPYIREYYYGTNLENLFEYCGLLEEQTEKAVGIDYIKRCYWNKYDKFIIDEIKEDNNGM